jgi:site-specific DNA-methyltransferase (adenine-specific)
MIELNKIYKGNYMDLIQKVDDKSIDLILTDPPYNRTNLEWDKKIDISFMMSEFLRIIKDNGAIIITSMFPFSFDLILCARKYFRYDLIWEKDRAAGFLNANRMPLRAHEHILFFYKKLPVYNPQKLPGKLSKSKSNGHCDIYGKYKIIDYSSDLRYPRSVLKFETPKCLWGKYQAEKIVHPTQKPIGLFEFLIKSYSNENDIILDSFIGSGTTAISAIKNNRNFIGFELQEKYVEIANRRINEFKQQQQ